MSKQGTVVEQKQLFLQSRKQLLSRGIPPSERLRSIADDGGIELSVLKGVMDKVNRDLKQHSRKVYSRQMIEHVVEQIDTLYWESGVRHADNAEADTSTDAVEDFNVLHQSDDLTLDENIAKLPAVWPASHDPIIGQDDYLEAMSRLQSLSAHRQALQNRLKTYHTLLALLEPYREPRENIQPNLVWKDTPLAPELAKVRSLAIRVAGRVEEKWANVQIPATAEQEEDDEGVIDMNGLHNEGQKKIERVLEGW